MLREDLSHTEQIIADYGYVSGAAHGYEKGWNDSQKLAHRDEKICFLLGTTLGLVAGGLVQEAVNYLEDHDVAEKAKNWAYVQKEKIKSKFTRKKNKKF